MTFDQFLGLSNTQFALANLAGVVGGTYIVLLLAMLAFASLTHNHFKVGLGGAAVTFLLSSGMMLAYEYIVPAWALSPDSFGKLVYDGWILGAAVALLISVLIVNVARHRSTPNQALTPISY